MGGRGGGKEGEKEGERSFFFIQKYNRKRNIFDNNNTKK